MLARARISTCLLIIACGCTPANNNSSGNVSMDGPPPATVDVHDHPSEGPHHGTLVELGKEEFHAEVVHTNDTVTVYFLDAHAEKSVAIDATEIAVNVNHEGKPEQFKLPATPQAGDSDGKSSCFSLTDAKLASHMDDHISTPKLAVMINGKAYRGEIHHDHASHDHSGHDHH